MMEEVMIEQLRILRDTLQAHPERLIYWEIRRDSLSHGIDREHTLTIRYAIPAVPA